MSWLNLPWLYQGANVVAVQWYDCRLCQWNSCWKVIHFHWHSHVWKVCSRSTIKNKHCTKKTANLVTFTEEILNGKLHFLCSDIIESFSVFLLSLLLTWKNYFWIRNKCSCYTFRGLLRTHSNTYDCVFLRK